VGFFLYVGKTLRGMMYGRFLCWTSPKKGTPPDVNSRKGSFPAGHSSVDIKVLPATSII